MNRFSLSRYLSTFCTPVDQKSSPLLVLICHSQDVRPLNLPTREVVSVVATVTCCREKRDERGLNHRTDERASHTVTRFVRACLVQWLVDAGQRAYILNREPYGSF